MTMPMFHWKWWWCWGWCIDGVYGRTEDAVGLKSSGILENIDMASVTRYMFHDSATKHPRRYALRCTPTDPYSTLEACCQQETLREMQQGKQDRAVDSKGTRGDVTTDGDIQ
ncbi:hypothetical protein C8F01DRAFT_1079613 [Mycena amicta]|nr:hypothetical protein C8F01DRAFT_1079613 [Mycena amicta]